MWRLGAHFESSPGGVFSCGASSATGLSNSIGPVPGRQSRHQLYSFVEEPNCPTWAALELTAQTTEHTESGPVRIRAFQHALFP